MRISTLLGAGIITLVGVAMLGGALIAPHASGEQFRDFLFAPPMRVHLRDIGGDWHAPFVYPLRLVDRVERRYEEDRTRRVPLVWFSEGKLVRARDETMGPLLLLGADSLGRDVFSRLVAGARTSLGVAFVAALGALVLGALVGGMAGYAGGLLDEVLMRVADFVVVLPAIYLVLALRAVMPLVLAPVAVFALMAGLLAVVGSPWVARGVRAIVAAERQRGYAAAAVSLGAGHGRLLFRHLLPATTGFLLVQATLLLPAFILAETTLSYVGLGFAEPTPSWGSMLQEAANVQAIADFPWLLAPAAGIVMVVLWVNLIAETRGESDPLSLQVTLERRYRRV